VESQELPVAALHLVREWLSYSSFGVSLSCKQEKPSWPDAPDGRIAGENRPRRLHQSLIFSGFPAT
jgi:hypothetical protein